MCTSLSLKCTSIISEKPNKPERELWILYFCNFAVNDRLSESMPIFNRADTLICAIDESLLATAKYKSITSCEWSVRQICSAVRSAGSFGMLVEITLVNVLGARPVNFLSERMSVDTLSLFICSFTFLHICLSGNSSHSVELRYIQNSKKEHASKNPPLTVKWMHT